MTSEKNVLLFIMILGLNMISDVSSIKLKQALSIDGCDYVGVNNNRVVAECSMDGITVKETFDPVNRCFEIADNGRLLPLENGNANASGRCKVYLNANPITYDSFIDGYCTSTSGEKVQVQLFYYLTDLFKLNIKEKKISCATISDYAHSLTRYFTDVSLNGSYLSAKVEGNSVSKNIGKDCFGNNEGMLKFRINGDSTSSCLSYSLEKTAKDYYLRAICKTSTTALKSSRINLNEIISYDAYSKVMHCNYFSYVKPEEVTSTEIDYDKTCHYFSVSEEETRTVNMQCLNQATKETSLVSKNIGTCFSYDNGNLKIRNNGDANTNSKCSSQKASLEDGVFYYSATCKNSSNKSITNKIKVDFLKNEDGNLTCEFPSPKTKLLADYNNQKIKYTCASPSISGSTLSMYCWNSSTKEAKISTKNIGKDCLSNSGGKLALKLNGGSNGTCTNYSVSEKDLTYTLKAKCKPTQNSTTYSDTEIELNSFLINKNGTLTCDFPTS